MDHVGYEVFVAGGSGTGKTKRVKKILKRCKRDGVEALVAAPTGVSPTDLSLPGRFTYAALFGLKQGSQQDSSESTRESQKGVSKREEDHEELEGGGKGSH